MKSSSFSATDILEIVRSFFAAILNVLKALGINFGDQAAEGETETQAE